MRGKGRTWTFQDQDGTHDITDKEILKTFYPWWKGEMTRVGKAHLINEESCIEDFIVVHWAWLKKERPQTAPKGGLGSA